MNILVLCTGNSARSILLESILNKQSGGRIHAWSAGVGPFHVIVSVDPVSQISPPFGCVSRNGLAE